MVSLKRYTLIIRKQKSWKKNDGDTILLKESRQISIDLLIPEKVERKAGSTGRDKTGAFHKDLNEN
jgi:hypothetical protein